MSGELYCLPLCVDGRRCPKMWFLEPTLSKVLPDSHHDWSKHWLNWFVYISNQSDRGTPSIINTWKNSFLSWNVGPILFSKSLSRTGWLDEQTQQQMDSIATLQQQVDSITKQIIACGSQLAFEADLRWNQDTLWSLHTGHLRRRVRTMDLECMFAHICSTCLYLHGCVRLEDGSVQLRRNNVPSLMPRTWIQTMHSLPHGPYYPPATITSREAIRFIVC